MNAWSGPRFYHSKLEDNPWLRVQLNAPIKITSVTVGNRKGCCGDRLKNLEIRAGMNNDLTNEVVGFYEGPGKTGEQYTIRLKVPVVAEFLSFQLKGKKQYLQIEGIRLNEQPALGEYKLNFTLDYIIHQRWGRLFSKKIGPPPSVI